MNLCIHVTENNGNPELFTYTNLQAFMDACTRWAGKVADGSIKCFTPYRG